MNEERSPQWQEVRAKWLKEHPSCEACGLSHETMEVHHKVPFHLDKSKELDEGNLITLCEHPSHNCHLIFGHLLDYQAFNPAVEADAATYLSKVKSRPITLQEAN